MKNWYEYDISKGILAAKYFHEGEDFEGFLNRVSGIFSNEIQSKVKEAMKDGKFFPAGRVLHGAGADKDGFRATPMNCYTMPNPQDNLESIFDTCKEMARTFSMGGGAGVNISNLRPKGAKVRNSAISSTGAVSFLNVINATGETIGAQGRRAAIMVGLDCTHPDLEEFLHIKETNHKLSSMNISILFTDAFFDAVKNNKPWKLHFEVKATGEKIERTINAREFFHRFCKVNYDYGDPKHIWGL